MTNEEILKANHFAIWQTGGGCTAWGKDFGNGKQVLIGRDSGHNVDENDTDYEKLGIHIGAQFDTEQGDFVNVEMKSDNIQILINFVTVLNEMDNDSLQKLADFEPFISI